MKRVYIITMTFAGMLFLSAINNSFAQMGQGMGRGMGQGMMERFSVMDADENGFISAAESAEWRTSAFLAMDADEDNKLTRKEYMSVQMGKGADPDMRGPRYAQKQAEKSARFTGIDTDKDDRITKEQFLSNGKARFKASDQNGDGMLSMAEFRAACMKH